MKTLIILSLAVLVSCKSTTPQPNDVYLPSPVEQHSSMVKSMGMVPQASLTGVKRFPQVGDYHRIPSNFDTSKYISGTVGVNLPGTAAPDVVGAFRFLCVPSHNLYDDPIVYPRKPGASHLHTFFGNTMTNAFSTYASLRKTGDGTCGGGPINRSAYWVPAMMNGKGQVVMPEYTTIYYKAKPGTRRLPKGLRMIFGYNMAEPPSATNKPPEWLCAKSSGQVTSIVGHKISEVMDQCPLDAEIGWRIAAPKCWDGVNLDSANHRSHLSNHAWDGGASGVPWPGPCPKTHPVEIPAFTIGVWYKHEGLEDLKNWYLSSDRMPGMEHEPGSTGHSDWFGGWDDDVLKIWMNNCIDKLLSCSAGVLGNGLRLTYPPLRATPRLMDPPAPPAAIDPTPIVTSSEAPK